MISFDLISIKDDDEDDDNYISRES